MKWQLPLEGTQGDCSWCWLVKGFSLLHVLWERGGATYFSGKAFAPGPLGYQAQVSGCREPPGWLWAAQFTSLGLDFFSWTWEEWTSMSL